MSIEHSTIADADRHEVKHASTALAGTVLIANGDGTTKFDAYDYNKLLNKPVPVGYLQQIVGSSTATSQAPTTTNTALQVEFGAAQSTANVKLDAAGNITFLVAGEYIIQVFFRFGRTAATGTAILFNRVKKNGVQYLNSNSLTLTDLNTVVPFSANLHITAAINDVFTFEIMRDSAGINNGGLTQNVPSAAGWNTSPSATVVIHKFAGTA